MGSGWLSVVVELTEKKRSIFKRHLIDQNCYDPKYHRNTGDVGPKATDLRLPLQIVDRPDAWCWMSVNGQQDSTHALGALEDVKDRILSWDVLAHNR